MSDIRPLPTEAPQKLRLHPVKTGIFIVIALGALLVGRLSSMRPSPTISSPSLPGEPRVLGEETRTIESYLPPDVKFAASMAAQLKGQRVDTHMIADVGRELVATAASQLSSQAEKAASSAAHNVTDFIYKNTIERLIDNLIQTLPPERQTHYQFAPSPTPNI